MSIQNLAHSKSTTSIGSSDYEQIRNTDKVMLNAFELVLSSPTFQAAIREFSNADTIETTRAEFGGDAFVYSKAGKIYILPKEPKSWSYSDSLVNLECCDHLQMISACINGQLPQRFSGFQVISVRPLSIAIPSDKALGAVKVGQEEAIPLMDFFKIKPKYKIDTRIITAHPGQPRLCLLIRFQSQWEILAQIDQLDQAGIDLAGLHVKYRQTQEHRSLVGRIRSVNGHLVELDESYSPMLKQIPCNEVMLEGSKQVFARCLKQLLSPSLYQRFEQDLEKFDENLFPGEAVSQRLEKFRAYFKKQGTLELFGGLSCTLEDQICVENLPDHSAVLSASQTEYCFDAARTKRSQLAWAGIQKYGPFSRDTLARRSPVVWVVFPDSMQGVVEKFLSNFRDGINNSRYAGGFSKLFCLSNPQFRLVPIPWLANSLQQPHKLYKQIIENQLATGAPNSLPDLALVFILDEHSQLPDVLSPYLHTKSLLLMAGVPTQEIKRSTASASIESLQFSMQNIATAMYAKMNGTPWTVDHDSTINDELVIGIGACELSGSRFQQRQRFVGITTVFRGDGNYLLGNLSRDCSFADYPIVLKESVVEILKDIKNRNGWQPGDTIRLVFHSFKPLKKVEIAEIINEAVQQVTQEQSIEFAFIDLSFEHPFLLLDKRQLGIYSRRNGRKKGVFVPSRGTIVEISTFSRLLAINGPSLIKRKTSALPAPILVRLHRLSTFRDLQYLSEQVLKFTALSWKSTLPAAKPVTIYYSEMIAKLLARFRSLQDWSPTMLNSKLRASRWFL